MRTYKIIFFVVLACLAHAATAHAQGRRHIRRALPIPPVVGFFCTKDPVACLDLPVTEPHQVLVWDLNASSCDPGSVLLVTRGTRMIGGYIDDSMRSREAPDQACAMARGMRVWAGELTFGSIANYPNWNSAQMPFGLQEWYPVLNHQTVISTPPRPGDSGYVLQSFSWSDTPQDRAVMGTGNRAPSTRQERRMWCAALRRHPRVVLWYYATAHNIPRILKIEQQPCY